MVQAMPARDIFHQNVRNALTKDGWTITDDPLTLQFGTTDVFVDLGAEKLIAAEKEGLYIAVEIKGFASASIITDFHAALGQFLNYRYALEQQDPRRALYLAIPIDAYSTFFVQPFVQAILQRYQLQVLVFEPEIEEVLQWIK